MIKLLSKSIREYKKDSILTPILITGEVIMECLIPYIIAQLVNAIKAGCGLPTIFKYGGILIVMAIISLGFGAAAGATCATASSGFGKNLRKDMFYKIQTFSFENIDKFSTSSLVTRMTTDIMNVQNAYMMIIRTAIRCPLMLIFSFVMAFKMGGKLAFLFAVLIPFLALAISIIAVKAMPLFKSVFRKYDTLNESIQENVHGMRVVKSFVREDYEKQKFGKAAEDVCRDFTRVEKILAWNMPAMQLVMYSTILGILTLGGHLVKQGELGIGQLTSFLSYVLIILNSLMMMSNVFLMMTRSLASGARIMEVLDEKIDITDELARDISVERGEIEFDHVNFKYKEEAEEYVLSDISFHIEPGQTVGIIGQTGSAKTTLVQLIPRLYDVNEGVVKIDGVDVKEYPMRHLRDAIAMVLQKNTLFSGSLLSNLKWGNENATMEEIEEACHIACVDEFIDRLSDGYDTEMGQGGVNVSGGQKQRICIARAILKKPKVLILDDSTSAVDTATEAKIREGLAKKLPDMTKIVIAQRISSVRHADQIIILDKGRINGIGTHESLLADNRIYQEIYESQKEGAEL